jgi:hypothetical protein
LGVGQTVKLGKYQVVCWWEQLATRDPISNPELLQDNFEIKIYVYIFFISSSL